MQASVGTPARCEANERASCLQGPLAMRLVPDRDPQATLHRAIFCSQATSLVTAWRGLTRPLLVRTLSCVATIKMPIHTRALRHLPPNTLDLLAKDQHDSFLFLCIQLLCLNIGADPPDVYLRRPMKCADLAPVSVASVVAGRLWSRTVHARSASPTPSTVHLQWFLHLDHTLPNYFLGLFGLLLAA